MSISMKSKAVIGVHIDKGNEWALIVTAYRDRDERQIEVMVFVMQHSPLASMCPQRMPFYLVSTSHVNESRRSVLLASMVKEYLKSVRANFDVLAEGQTGLLANLPSLSRTAPLGNFVMNDARVVQWFFDSAEYGEAANKALDIARKLARKHKLDELSVAEREQIAVRQIVGR